VRGEASLGRHGRPDRADAEANATNTASPSVPNTTPPWSPAAASTIVR
jgi:hypothetical protein